MALTVPIPLAFGRFKHLPQRTGEVWQGGLVRLPAWVEDPADPEGEPSRQIGALWVSLRTGLIHLAIPDEGADASPEFALSALLEFGLKWAKQLEGRPSRVEVRDDALREALAEPLSRLTTSVVQVAELPAVREALQHLETEAGEGLRLPGALEAPGVTLDRLRAFAAAAAGFYQARPWDQLADIDRIVIESPGLPEGMSCVSVLGQGGQQFGLALFESSEEFEDLLDPQRSAERAYGVTFGPIDDLPFADADAWEDHVLPVAGTHAYPVAADLRDDGSMFRPDGRELTGMEALLRALADFSEDELDTGRWQRRVETFDGPMELTFTLPGVLEGAAADALTEVSGGDRTPLDQAQELAYEAMQLEGRRQIALARRAVALSPDCADAWVILGDRAPTPELALELYERGVEAGARALGPERLTTPGDGLWQQLDARPYLRARLALALILRGLGRHEEQLDHCRELLRLNPNDEQGVRYALVAALLNLERNDEAGVLLDRYDEDIQALWPYARAIWRFRTDGGDSERARRDLAHAVDVNPHVAGYLRRPESMPDETISHFALGSREEAAYVAEGLGYAFEATPGAIEWLGSRTSGRRGRGSKRPARRSRR